MASKCKLTYFTIKGLAEPIRYLLSYHDIKFEDIRLDVDTWRTSVKEMAPFGRAPILEIDGKILTQSKAICRYLAKDIGLTGNDNWENFQIDSMVETADDILYGVADYYYDFDEKSKAEKKDPLLNETLPFYMKKFDTMVEENDGYLANKRLTWADIYFVAVTEHICFMLDQDVFEPYLHLKALKDTIDAIPNIKKYIEKRPTDIRPLF